MLTMFVRRTNYNAQLVGKYTPIRCTLVSLLIARTNFSEFSDDGIIAKNSTRNLAQLLGIAPIGVQCSFPLWAPGYC